MFRLGEDGLVSVLRDEVHGEERDLVENAVRNCPMSALSITDTAADPAVPGA